MCTPQLSLPGFEVHHLQGPLPAGAEYPLMQVFATPPEGEQRQ